MARYSRKTTEHGPITLIEHHHTSGLAEIAAYIPGIAANAGAILCGVASRQDVGCKWVVYTDGPTLRTKIKREVIAILLADADNRHRELTLHVAGKTEKAA